MNKLNFTPKLLIFTGLILLISCHNSKDRKLESALELAGENRTELQKVLDHYSQNPADSLKLEAAKFLIENMRWHSGNRVLPSDSLWDLFLLEDSLVMGKLQFPGNPDYLNQCNRYKYGGLREDLVKRAMEQSVVTQNHLPDLQYLSFFSYR